MTDALRVLMVADVSPLTIQGGGERVLWEQASRLAARDRRVSVVSRSPSDHVPEAVERRGVHIHHFPADRRSPLRFLLTTIRNATRAVDDALVKDGGDLLQLYQPLSGYGALRSARARTLPVLYTFLSPTPLEYLSRSGMTAHHRPGPVGRAAQAILWLIERACLQRASRIHVLSDFSAGQLWKLYRIPSDRIVKIPAGADLERFRPAGDRITSRTALDVPPDVPLFLTVRNLEARMGLDTLISAVALLRQQVPRFCLLVGGTGSRRGALESLSASLNLGHCVRFLGYIPDLDLPTFYQAADAFVLPTRELEGFGLVTAEALACGTPVLGTAVGATPEILEPLDPALVVRDLTPEALAETLGRFIKINLQDPATGRRLRQACRRHAETHYSWDLSVSQLDGLLADMAATRITRPAGVHGIR
ncbi:MAG TPA: glycosyltransferase family 4 protein [Candidatus Acidoferrum sp.]|nr:glycosyltransferase family 4 protein [Candidatus Acidoferrum sp.]